MTLTVKPGDVRARPLQSPDEQLITARLAAAGSHRAELEALLDTSPNDATTDALRTLVVDSNATGKGSAAARAKTWTNLKLRYVLDPAVAEYRAFAAAVRSTRMLDERGLLCMLMLARTDRLFREVTLARVSPHLGHAGTVIDASMVQAEIEIRAAATGGQWTASTLETVRQHLLSALKDFGVLRGGPIKRTVLPRPGAPVVVFAARLGLLEGLTDRQVLDARWYQLIGLDRETVADHLRQAAREGLVGFQMQADVVELSLPALEVGQ
jgi:hypothetical protein